MRLDELHVVVSYIRGCPSFSFLFSHLDSCNELMILQKHILQVVNMLEKEN